jgi:hypothetical protein
MIRLLEFRTGWNSWNFDGRKFQAAQFKPGNLGITVKKALARGEDRITHGAGNALFPDIHPASHAVDVTPAIYLRAAHAYMLISMPTGTSTIFGAFQAIVSLLG